MIETILNASLEPIFIYDEENLKFLAVNDAAVEFYGYPREQFLQMDLTDLYPPKDIQSLIEYNKDDSDEFEKPVRHKLGNGSEAIVRLRRKKIEYKGNKAFITFVKDITETSDTNKDLRELKVLFEISRELIFETDVDGFIEAA